MTQPDTYTGTLHDHAMNVPGCFRCDLSRDEVTTHTVACDDGDYEFMCPECQQAADATRCQMCDGTGVYSDEDMSCACPYCGATGEADL